MDTPAFDSSPDPDNPGWFNWQMVDASRYNGTVLGKLIVRSEGEGKARLRMFPEHRHSNLGNAVHGGTTLGFIDVATTRNAVDDERLQGYMKRTPLGRLGLAADIANAIEFLATNTFANGTVVKLDGGLRL